MHSQSSLASPRSSPARVQSSVRFAFSGRMEELLADCLERDAQNWKLSWKFRLYYALRPWIPLACRQFLQKRRNSSLPVGDEWYVSNEFLQAWEQAVAQTVSEQPGLCVIHPWPDGHSHAMVLSHDIESEVGLRRVDRLAKLEEKFGFRSAWFVVPHKYAIDAGLLEDLRQRGHEVGVHGYNHDGRLFTSAALFHRRCQSINQTLSDWQAVGFRSPMMHRQLEWMQQLHIDYDASCFDVDPFQAMPGGVGGVWPFMVGRFVELPCTLPQDHTLFLTLQESSIRIWQRKYALIRRLQGLAMCIVHPDYLDSPARWQHYEDLLRELQAADGGWSCLPSQAAAWWRDRDASQIVRQAITGPAAPRGRLVSLQTMFA